MNLNELEPKRILLTRLSAIGDCVLTIPLAVAAKKLWPASEIFWVVECAAEQLLRSHPAVDHVIPLRKGWLGRPKEWLSVRKQMRGLECDLVLDPQGLSKSALLGWLSGAKFRLGFDQSHAREIAPMLASHTFPRTQRHMVDSYLELLQPWRNVTPEPGQFEMPRFPAEADKAEHLLDALGLQNNWVGINPGAGWTTRLWPVERFGQLAHQLHQDHGLRSLVFWAGESERLMASVIVEESEGAAVLAPSTTLPEMLELLRRCRLFVTGDTGPLHLSSSVGTPCVSLHGPTRGDESGPYGNQNKAIQSPQTRTDGKLVRRGENLAMQAIQVEEVRQACSELLVATSPLQAAS